MHFIAAETELTTAFTDIALALVSLWAVLTVFGKREDFSIPLKPLVWVWAFSALTAAGVLGFFAHGFEMSDGLRNFLWQPLNLALGITVALFLAGVLIDLRQQSLSPLIMGLLVGAAVLFYLITLIFPGSFLVFIAYEAFAMFTALAVYIRITLKSGRPWAGWMTLGIALSISAALIQALKGVELRVIWVFDHNGLFHLIQMAGIAALVRGIISSGKGESTRG